MACGDYSRGQSMAQVITEKTRVAKSQNSNSKIIDVFDQRNGAYLVDAAATGNKQRQKMEIIFCIIFCMIRY